MKKYIALAILLSSATLVHAQDDANGACEKMKSFAMEGVAPKQIIATKYVDDDPAKGVTMTWPLCPYPQAAQWDGKGKVEAAASFSCK